MSGFTLLWSKLLESSLWVQESKETRLVWITLLAMKDSTGKVQASVVGLADRAKVTLDECKTALSVLLSKDPNDTSKVEEGRRIREIPGGWEVINHDLYRFSTDAKRAYWREAKAQQRAKSKPVKRGVPLAGEAAFVKADASGNHKLADEIAGRGLPESQEDHVEPGSGELSREILGGGR